MILFGWLFILWTFLLHKGFFSSIDKAFYSLANENFSQWGSYQASVTFLGDSHFLFPATFVLVIFFLFRGAVRQAVLLGFFFPLGMLFNYLIKLSIHRLRPTALMELGLATPSYPSGHAFGSVVFYCLALSLIVSKWPPFKKINVLVFVMVMLLILVIGSSRVFLGAHWFSDVVGGYFLGALWVCLALGVKEHFEKS